MGKDDELLRKEKKEEPQWNESKLYRQEHEFENPLYKSQEVRATTSATTTTTTTTTMEEPQVVVEQRMEPQLAPNNIYTPPEPVQAQQGSKKQRKKAEKVKRNQIRQEVRQEQATTLQRAAAEPEGSVYKTRITDYNERKLYGKMANNAAFLQPDAVVLKTRNATFYALHSDLQRGALTRDLSEFMGTDELTDEQMLQMHTSIMASTNKENPEPPSPELLTTYNAGYNRIFEQFTESGLTRDDPINCPEDYILRANKAAPFYRAAQITRDIGNKMPAGTIPMEKLAFVSAACEYVKNICDAADLCMLTEQDVKSATTQLDAKYAREAPDILRLGKEQGLYTFKLHYDTNIKQRRTR